MASFSIHLAIANKYLENYNVENKMDFIRGVIAPDLVENKAISHYGRYQSRDNAYTFFATKVELLDYLRKENDDSSYQKGVFLHLATDYIFFNDFFSKEFLEENSVEKFSSDIYYSYDLVNDYVDKKYDVNYYDFKEQVAAKINVKKVYIDEDMTKVNLLPKEKLDKFIEYMGNIDLDIYREKLLKFNCNVLP